MPALLKFLTLAFGLAPNNAYGRPRTGTPTTSSSRQIGAYTPRASTLALASAFHPTSTVLSHGVFDHHSASSHEISIYETPVQHTPKSLHSVPPSLTSLSISQKASHTVPSVWKPSHLISSISKPSRSASLSHSPTPSGTSSKRPLPTSRSSTASGGGNGCPPVPVPTVTVATSFSMVTASVVSTDGTFYFSASDSTRTISAVGATTTYTYSYLPEFTQTVTFTIAVPTSQSTVTVPTPSGFTPIGCVAGFQTLPTITATTISTVTVTPTSFSYTVTTTFTADELVYSSTATVTSTTRFTTFTTVTRTTTVADTSLPATTTSYAACATNNIVSRDPEGRVLPTPDVSKGVTNAFRITAIDTYACCVKCLLNPNCYGTYSVASEVIGDPPGAQYCLQLIPAADGNTTCNPTFRAANIPFGYRSTFGVIYSNGACGQFSAS